MEDADSRKIKNPCCEETRLVRRPVPIPEPRARPTTVAMIDNVAADPTIEQFETDDKASSRRRTKCVYDRTKRYLVINRIKRLRIFQHVEPGHLLLYVAERYRTVGGLIVPLYSY